MARERHRWTSTVTAVAGQSVNTLAALVDVPVSAPRAVALASPTGDVVTYASLAEQCKRVSNGLGAQGVGNGRAVAVILPNGLDMAVAFLGIAGATVCAPLDPALTEAELRFFLADIDAAAVVVEDGHDGPGVVVARERSIPVLPLSSLLECGSGESSSGLTPREPDDVALVLHTSGTTSRPKQVALTHANLIASGRNVATTLGLGREDRCLNVMPLFHIHGLVAALLASLSSGGSVVCAPGMDPTRFFGWARDSGATWYTAVPTIHHSVLAAASADPSVLDGVQFRFARSSSAALAPSLFAELEATLGVPVVEAYGMTEASHQMASNPLPPAVRKPGTVGVAAGPEVTILDESGAELPRGAVGEIAVRGSTVMTAYVANPEATAAAFEGDWFRTGDQGVIDADGYITITGRLKELINRGGEKISPREVDEVLLEHPAVEQVVTFAISHPTLGEDVAAAVVLTDERVSDTELRAFASAQLADHKVPRRFVRLAEIPKGPTGKIQRIGFAERVTPARSARTTFDSPFEAAVGGVWRDVLHVENVGPDDDFFSLGGDSLRAMELVTAVSDVFGVELAIRDVLESAATVAGMASCIEAARRDGRLSTSLSDGFDRGSDSAAPSLAQEREWFLAALADEQPVGNVTLAMRLHGPLHRDRLERALDELVARHEMLRACFTLKAGRPTIAVSPVGRVALQLHAAADRMTIESDAAGRAAEPFDLTRAPLLRAHLYPVANDSRTTASASQHDEHVLLVVAHHIIADGWTRRILHNELAALYAGDHVPSPSVGYLELAQSERADLASGSLDGDLRWWAEQFESLPEPLLLPGDRRRPPRLDLRTHTVTTRFDEELSGEVRAFAAREQVTLFTALLAAFEALVARHTGRSDFVIGVLTNGRKHASARHVVGLFSGIVPLRSAVHAEATFRDLLVRVRSEWLDAFDRQVPMQLIVDAVHPERRADALPLAQVLFQLRNLPPSASMMGDIGLETVEVPTGANAAEIECDVIDDGASLSVRCEFSSAVFDVTTIERLLARYEMLLRHAVAAPDTPVGRLDLLTPAERSLLDGFGRGPELTPTTQGVEEMVAARARDTPDAIALIADGERLTYAQFDQWINRIAHQLQAMGVAPGGVVGLCLRREAAMVATLHAVWRAGGTVVPLDPSWPALRMEMVADVAGLEVVVVHRGLVDQLPAWIPTIVIDDPSVSDAIALQPGVLFEPARRDGLAYVIFTSGSTGRPKGVEVEDASLSTYCEAHRAATGLCSSDVVLASHPITFDASIDALVVAFTAGASVVLADDRERNDPHALISLIDRERVTIVHSTPSVLATLVAADWWPGDRVEVWPGGEALAAPLADELVQRCGRVLNMYGPTETTVYVSQHEVGRSDLGGDHTVPIGRPAGDHRFVVVDDAGEPAPIGAYGELLIAGRCVARGYRNQPDLTAAAFVDRPDPFTSEPRRWYRTGDVVRWRADGVLEYLGRRDAQVKLRGVRIELGDVEATLSTHPSVAAVAAAVRSEQLVAWIVASGDTPIAADLRRHCAERLPMSMVPAVFVVVDELPHNANGKLDRDALPALVPTDRPRGREPSTPTEMALTDLWRELLGADSLNVDEEFFDLGGHSLLVISLFAAIEERFGQELPLSQIFESPTIASLAAVLDAADPVTGSVVTLRDGDNERPALFLVPGIDGSSVIFHRLHRQLDVAGAVFGVEMPSWRRKPEMLTMEELAAQLLPDVVAAAGGRPIVLAGFSFGGSLAFEMARQLAELDSPCRLVIVDSGPPGSRPWQRPPTLSQRAGRAARHPVRWWRAHRAWVRRRTDSPARWIHENRAARHWAKRNYNPPQDYRHDVVLLTSAASIASSGDPTLGWRRYVSGSIQVRRISGDHKELMKPPTESEIAAILSELMRRRWSVTRP